MHFKKYSVLLSQRKAEPGRALDEPAFGSAIQAEAGEPWMALLSGGFRHRSWG